MGKMFEDLKDGLSEIDSYLAGTRIGFKVIVPAEIDVKSIRKRLHMTQASFLALLALALMR